MTTPLHKHHLTLYVGPTPPTFPDEEHPPKVVDITPTDTTPEAINQAIKNAELTPSDMRARVLFATEDDTYRDKALATYAFLIAFANRRLDAIAWPNKQTIPLAQLHKTVQNLTYGPRPDQRTHVLQIGGPARTDIPQITIVGAPTTELLTTLRYAKHLRFVPPASAAQALQQFTLLAAARTRGHYERFPNVCTGKEPEPTQHIDTAGLALTLFRLAGETARQNIRSDTRTALATPIDSTEFTNLTEADARPVEETLTRLGTRYRTVEVPITDPETGEETIKSVDLWHCPRPQRHTNGDANPSARVTTTPTGIYFQCFRCDEERVGSLRLVMDVKQLTATEAATWLLTPDK